MKERFKQFVEEKRAVSPVIGVVLMVAVVVILAAVIAAFVLGLGGSQQTTPQASFSYQDGILTMSSGDAINGANLYYTVDGGDRQNWGGTGDVVAGDSQDIGDATQSVKVIYDDGKGNSAVLTSINLGGDDAATGG